MQNLASGSEEKANKMIAKADAKLKGWWVTDSDRDAAMELYSSAANQLKIAQQWDRCGECYQSAAQTAMMCKNILDASTKYQEAASAYRHANNNAKYIEMMNLVIPLHLNSGRMSAAAKLYQQLAEISEQDMKEEEAVKYYGEAAQFFQAENSNVNANTCRVKQADLLMNLEQYERARSILEEVASDCLGSNLLKFKCKDYYFKSSLCTFAEDCKLKGGNIDNTKASLQRYGDLYPAFVASREYKLIATLLEAFENVDLNSFESNLQDFEAISPLDNQKVKLLTVVKNQMINPSMPSIT